jgi:hypothetical protein
MVVTFRNYRRLGALGGGENSAAIIIVIGWLSAPCGNRDGERF